MKRIPRPVSRSSASYTEEEMADAFEELLSRGTTIPGIGRLTRVFREIDCHRGRPDFIALAHGTSRLLTGRSIEAKSAGSLLMSFLHFSSPRSITYLATQSGLAMRTVRTTLDELTRARHICQRRSGSYVLNPARRIRDVQVWAFELKIGHPRRALFQAQQYRLFAQRVMIVVPPDQAHLFAKRSETMRRWGIGLASFDATRGQFEVYRRPRIGGPQSRQHQAYALFQLLEQGEKSREGI